MANKIIRLSKSCIGNTEKAAVAAVLDREYLGMGVDVQQFESELSKFFEGRPVACVSTGTGALHLAVQCANVGPGDEVLVQSLTFVACFQAIRATGAIPVSCEVNPKTVTIDIRDAEKRLTLKTKAIMPVHYGGGVGDLEEIYLFAKKHGLRVIEDASHAFGTYYKGKKIGTFGDIACFSFDGIKNITAGEGGAVVTEDLSVIEKIKDARLLGVEKDTEKRYNKSRSWEFDVSSPGWRYHMSNIMAAIGIEQLKRFPDFAEKRKALARRYVEKLSGEELVELLNLNFDEVVPHIFVVRLKGVDKKVVQALLLDNGIQTGFHYMPNHLLSLFRAEREVSLPVTEALVPKLLTLPLHPDLTVEEVDFICENLKKAVVNVK